MLPVETFSWDVSATAQDRPRPVSRIGVTRWNSCFYHHWNRCDRCRSRKRFYFSRNLSQNRPNRWEFSFLILHFYSCLFLSTLISTLCMFSQSENAMRVIPKYYILFPFLVLIFVLYVLVTMQPLGLTFILLISVLCPLSQVRSSCTILPCKIGASLLFTSYIKLHTLSQSNFHSLHNLCCNLRSLLCRLRLVHVIGDIGVSHPVWITHTCRATNKMLQPCGQLG